MVNKHAQEIGRTFVIMDGKKNQGLGNDCALQIVYIVSLVRSGSTFLQYLLSAHPGIVGLGEIGLTIREYTKPSGPSKAALSCTCGEEPRSCPFWGPILQELRGMSKLEAFKLVLERFVKLFPGKVLLDSSKQFSYFEELYIPIIEAGYLNVMPKIIFLVRDFRGWSLSINRHLIKDGKANLWNAGFLFNSYRWLYLNLKLFNQAKRSNVPVLSVYYENLVFDLKRQLHRIYNFLELEFAEPGSFDKAVLHELYGSQRMKRAAAKGMGVVYDPDWMQEWRFLLYGPLLLPVAVFNEKYAKQTKDRP